MLKLLELEPSIDGRGQMFESVKSWRLRLRGLTHEPSMDGY